MIAAARNCPHTPHPLRRPSHHSPIADDCDLLAATAGGEHIAAGFPLSYRAIGVALVPDSGAVAAASIEIAF